MVGSEGKISPNKEYGGYSGCPNYVNRTKDFIRQKFGSYKTKELLTFDEGIVEREAPFLTVARPIATTLERLDAPGRGTG